MGGRRLLVTAVALSALGGVNASAAPPGNPAPGNPAPTASVTTYLAGGTASPVTAVSAAWSQLTPGCAGSLEASGPVVAGTTTVVTGDFVSRPFRPRGGRLADFIGNMGGRRLVQPFPEGFDLSIRLRVVGRHWTPWFTLGVTVESSVPPDLLLTHAAGAGLGFAEAPARRGHQLPLQQVQLKLHDEITSSGTADDVFRVEIGC